MERGETTVDGGSVNVGRDARETLHAPLTREAAGLERKERTSGSNLRRCGVAGVISVAYGVGKEGF